MGAPTGGTREGQDPRAGPMVENHVIKRYMRGILKQHLKGARPLGEVRDDG